MQGETMNKLIHRQKGMTFLGFVILMAVIAAFVLFGLRLFPLYNTKMGLVSVMKSVASQPNAENFNQTDVWKVFYNNADIQGLRVFTEQVVREQVKLEKNEDGSGKTIHVTFEERNKLFDDIELILVFDETMPMGGGAGGGDE